MTIVQIPKAHRFFLSAANSSLVLCFIFLCSFSYGSVLTVSSTIDGAPNSFRAVVATAMSGDTIIFDASTNGTSQSLVLGEVVLNKNLKIWGNGNLLTMIDGALMSRMLNIMPPATNVQIRGISFKDGFTATSGGAIMNQSVDVQLSACHITNCIASGALATEGGGAISNVDGTIIMMDNTLIMNNSAPGTSGSGGGILSASGTITIINSAVNNNSASRAGGGIEIIEGSLNITNSDIKENMLMVNPAPGNGAGIHISGASAFIVIETSLVDGNIAAQEGGGIWNQAGCVLNISETQISNNEANGVASDDGGGGIFNNGGIVAIDDASAILLNRANGTNASGGGIFSTGGTINIENALISSNYSKFDGGGIFNEGVLDMNSTTIELNTADNHGGGLYNTGGVTMESLAINNNIAALSGGGIHQKDNPAIISIESSFITNNTSGTCGGTCIAAGMATISNSTLSSNLGAVGGDILSVELGAQSDISNSTVTQ